MQNPIFNIHDLILILTLTVCVLLIAFQWLLSTQRPITSLLLSGFFMGVGLTAFCNLLLWNRYIEVVTNAGRYALACGLVLAVAQKSVCLYLYVQAITQADFRWRRAHLWHVLHPSFALFFIAVGELDAEALRFLGAPTDSSIRLANILWDYLKLLPVIYAFAAVLAVRRYHHQLTNYYSTFSLQGPRWLFLLALGFALSWAWSLAVHLLGQKIPVPLANAFGITDNYVTFLLINALFIYSLLYAHSLLVTRTEPPKLNEHEQRDIQNQSAEVVSGQQTEFKADPTQQKPGKLALVAPETITAIRAGMEERELYLIPTLNIEEFARQVGIPYREVSAIINTHFSTNFFEFVNAYRINRAKQLLQDPAEASKNIMDILLESGFNSKSSFNRFFKRYTGISAAEFRKQHQAEQR